MVPHLQKHQGLAKQSLLHGAGQHTAGFQFTEVVHSSKYKVICTAIVMAPESSIWEHPGTGFGDL